nr:peroxiredoxin [Nannocystis sp.]
MPQIGDKAPDFDLPNHKRERVSLASLRGKTVVLAFFPAAFTGVCEKELCSFRDSLAALNDLNATVLGISVDAPFSNAAFAERNQLTSRCSRITSARRCEPTAWRTTTSRACPATPRPSARCS